MIEYPKNKKYERLADKFLYSSRMRSILGTIEIKGRDLLSEAAALKIGMMPHESRLGGRSGIKKATLYAMILLSSYIPFGRAGYEYVKKRLCGKPVFEMQYESALNNLS